MQQHRQTERADKGNCMEQHQKQEGQQIGALEFVLTMERLPELKGTEGTNQIRKFFKKFSSATKEWTESRRISALESKMIGKAERAFDAAMKHRPKNFNEICRGMEGILSEWDCTEIRAFNELWEGVKRRPEETLDEFAERIYGIVDRAHPGLPPNFVSDFAIKHLIRAVKNLEISVGLELARRPGMSFDSFVALAVRAEAAQKATKSAESGNYHRPTFQQKTTVAPQKTFVPRTNRVVCYNCNKMGHISRNFVFAGTFSKERSKIGQIWKGKSPTSGSDDEKGRKANGKLGTIFSPKSGEELVDTAATNFENWLKISKSLSFPIDDLKSAQEAAADEFIKPGLILQRDSMPK
ncbi:hypothetical protein niasHS_009223 [Heterodera schachtii]|uniref:CCHC-type domain-containing protein n=1 Tax=Heterodera schachtii TaxID=97005 RepID=A0ABD2JBG6_HETSC